MTFRHWRLHFADGSRARGTTLAEWAAQGTTGVQVVTFFFNETYPIYKQDGYDERGRPINQRLERENYCLLKAGEERCWFVDGTLFGAGAVEDVPLGLPAGALKSGSRIDEESLFYTAYNDADRSRDAEAEGVSVSRERASAEKPGLLRTMFNYVVDGVAAAWQALVG